MTRVTAAECEALLAQVHPASTCARALAELAELRGRHGGYEPPSSWRVVSGDDEESWLAARDEYLTASDVASYIGVGKYANPREAVRRKATKHRLRRSDAMKIGACLEDGIVLAGALLSGRRFVRLRSTAGASVLVAHPTIPRLAASLDAVELGDDGTPVAAVEVKATKGYVKSYYGWPSTRVQLQVQMACTGLPRGHIVVSAGTDTQLQQDIPVREDFVADLPGIVQRFWDDVHAYRRDNGV
jgi:hypothetical protein